MRSIILLVISTISITLNAQTMETIQEKVSLLFIHTDKQEWNEVETIFADQVELDYSSMNGNPAVILGPEQITDSWKTVLPGFTNTHHQIGNVITTVNDKRAEVFCYGTATHYLGDAGGNLWTVVGSYDFELKQEGAEWKISKMKFNFKYEDGNTALPAKAMENVTNKR